MDFPVSKFYRTNHYCVEENGQPMDRRNWAGDTNVFPEREYVQLFLFMLDYADNHRLFFLLTVEDHNPLQYSLGHRASWPIKKPWKYATIGTALKLNDKEQRF